MQLPLPLTVNCSIVFPDVPLLERPAAAAAAGFDAVEFWWPFTRSVPADREVEEFVTAVSDAGVVLSGLNFDAGGSGQLAQGGEHPRRLTRLLAGQSHTLREEPVTGEDRHVLAELDVRGRLPPA